MMAKSWDNVTSTTIQNCWKKAKFPAEVTESIQDPFESSDESDEEDVATDRTESRDTGDTIWERLARHYPSIADMSFGEFASVDDDLFTERQLTAEDATREALEAAKSTEDTESRADCSEVESEEDEVEIVEPPKILSSLQATEHVRNLRDFVFCRQQSQVKKSMSFCYR
ncbi:uncharacterized protein LOC110245772 [Exaiptasia diaphana]|uniref:Uncharacterized protein n=1 Tax=Exaiptasia diaphana TaxID=2652724 RepID=A0A913XQN5_EXADI|nr:uncharacterized protein LOC110245772 [Exaiptasia diaphana]